MQSNDPSMKHFVDHVPDSSFNNQETLARALDDIGKKEILESKDVSPLTIRLFCAMEGLLAIRHFLTSFSSPAKLPGEFRTSGCFEGEEPTPRWQKIITSSGSAVRFPCYETYEREWRQDPSNQNWTGKYLFNNEGGKLNVVNKDAGVSSFGLHSGVYTFFSNIDSVLDRVRLELNSIYFDGETVSDSNSSKGNKYWSQYLKKKDGRIELMQENEFSGITSVLLGDDSISLDDRTSKYRDRLIHDGILNIKVDDDARDVFLPDDPKKRNPKFQDSLGSYVTDVFRDLQGLLHSIYDSVIADLNGKDKLPLIQ